MSQEGHKFFLEESEVGVKPVLTGDEPDPLKLSIQKWQFIVDCLEEGRQVQHDGGVETCALCAHYKQCTECPVCRFTDRLRCNRTPILMWERGLCTLAVAKAELYFLIALREYAKHMGWKEGEA